MLPLQSLLLLLSISNITFYFIPLYLDVISPFVSIKEGKVVPEGTLMGTYHSWGPIHPTKSVLYQTLVESVSSVRVFSQL